MMDNNMNRNVETIKSLPEDLLAEIQNLAKLHGLTDVLLFGSRARADHSKTSDIDLAVRGGNVDAFALDLEEEARTLLKFDCVDLDRPVSRELLSSINREGVKIYEKDR